VSSASEPQKAQRPLRILIADDDRDTVLMLMMIFQHEGHDTLGVYKGVDVLKVLREYDPDAVLLDINMPELNGYHVARAIRDAPGRRKPLLIGTSGVYKKGADRVLAQIVGFDHYLTKPYAPSDLLRLIEPLKFMG
jgi:DNA-binding response OmpR family regulator